MTAGKMVGRMNPVKRIAILLCSMILVSFTLAGFVFNVDLFSVHYREHSDGQSVYRITEHSKQSIPSADTVKDEAEMFWKNIQMGKLKLVRSGLIFAVCLLVFFLSVWRFSPLWMYLRIYRCWVFHMTRFRSELITQKEKDGKKRVEALNRYFPEKSNRK